MPRARKNIARSYWVIPGRFRAGEYPGATDQAEAGAKLRWLLDQDIQVFIDLTVPDEYGLTPYENLLAEEARFAGKAIQYMRFPIADFSVPEQDQVGRILAEIERVMEAGHNIYLHCFGGTGRTGTVVGCYLAAHSYPGRKALDQIVALRQDLPNADRQSPETPGQRKLVEEWKTGKVNQ